MVTTGVRDEIRDLLESLDSRDTSRRQMGVLRVQALKRRELIREFIGAAKNGTRQQKIALCRFFQARPDTAKMEVLVRLMREPDRDLAHAAADAAAELPMERAVGAIAKLSAESSEPALLHLAKKYGEKNDPDVIGALVALAANRGRAVRIAALAGLARYDTKRVRRFFIGNLSRQDPDELIVLLTYLARHPDAGTVAAVRPLLTHESAAVREAASRALIAAGQNDLLTEIRQVVARETDPQVIHSIFIALGERRSADTADFLLDIATGSGNPDARQYAAGALRYMADEAKEKILFENVRADDMQKRAAIYGQLGYLASEESFQILLGALRSESDETALAAALEALGLRNDPRALPEFRRILKSKRPTLALAAAKNIRRLLTPAETIGILGELGDAPDEVVAALLGVLHDFVDDGRCLPENCRGVAEFLGSASAAVRINAAKILAHCAGLGLESGLLDAFVEEEAERVRDVAARSYAEMADGSLAHVIECWRTTPTAHATLVAVIEKYRSFRLDRAAAAFLAEIRDRLSERILGIAFRDNLDLLLEMLEEGVAGIDELTSAALSAPQILLDGPDLERLLRLLGKRDALAAHAILDRLLDQKNVFYVIRWIEGLKDETVRARYRAGIRMFVEKTIG